MIGLRKIRKMLKYSQLKVAMALNISRESISYYKNSGALTPLFVL